MNNFLRNIKARISLSFKGHFGQFNITLLILGSIVVLLSYLFYSLSNKTISYIGLSLLLFIALYIIYSALKFFLKQEVRPVEGEPSSITVESIEKGLKINLFNPPDTFYKTELMRSLLVSFDPNICSDGEVLGKSAEQNYRWYTDEEKIAFQQKHKKDVSTKKKQIEALLSESDQSSEDISPLSPEGISDEPPSIPPRS